MTTLGDLIYGAASGTETRLAGNTTSTKKFLTQTGTGTASAAPSWGTIAAGDVPTLNQNTTGTAASFTGNLTGDVTSSAMATTIANNAVTNAKLAQMAANSIKGNNTGASANAADLTATQATAMLNAVVGDSGSGGTKGLVPAPASGDAAAGKYLKADGTWSAPASGDVPVGADLLFSGASLPSGYLWCDGSAVSRSTYSALFSAIGSAHGSGDGSTTFNVPDYRGRFIRGTDNMGTGAASRDPGSASRTAMATGGNTGNNVGSIQTDQVQGHWHILADTANSATTQALDLGGGSISGTGGANVNAGNSSRPYNATTMTTDNTGSYGTPRVGTETRPINAYANFIIKY
jgi:microcystin-dependent protein